MRRRTGWQRAVGFHVALVLVAVCSPDSGAQTSPALDPAREAAARDLMAAQGGIEQGRKAMTQMMNAMIAEMRRTSPDAAPQAETFLKGYFSSDNPKVSTYLDKVVQSSVAFYAARFTVEELRQVTAFVSSPVGAKFSAVAPEATTVIVPHFLEFQKQVTADIQAAARRGEFGKKQ